MQWFEVAQAEEIGNRLMPRRVLKKVAIVAEAVEHIAFGTANGPTRFRALFADGDIQRTRQWLLVDDPARAHDDAGAIVRRPRPAQGRHRGRGLIHRNMIPGRAAAMEAH